MTLARSVVLTLILSILGAALGAWAGANYVTQRIKSPTPLHETVHMKLQLTGPQKEQIAVMERQHAARRQVLEAEMRAANVDLARAMQADHTYTPQVQAAIDRFHRAMGELQKETIVHVLALRSVLTPPQAAKFDKTVAQVLVGDPS